MTHLIFESIILVLMIGGKDHVTSQKAIYTWYPGIEAVYAANWVIIYYLPPTTRTRIIHRNIENIP